MHGEAERNDMVEYFGEQLWGYGIYRKRVGAELWFTSIKPPILYGDIYSPGGQMTVDWIQYAQEV